MPGSRSKGWNYLENRFGVKREELGGYRLHERKDDLWLVPRGMETELDIETPGFRFLRQTGHGLKPTTYALQFLDGKLEKNVVEVSREELMKLLKREEMIPRDLESDGYVALRFDGDIIGCGFYQDDVVSSRVPKGRSKQLIRVFED